MRTKTQDKRLLKLIDWLDHLEPDEFNFEREVSEVKENGKVCATVACAIGWTPKIFPKLVDWVFKKEDYRGPYYIGFKMGDRNDLGYGAVGEELFGVMNAGDLFYPNAQQRVHPALPSCGHNATPQQVAAMLREYRKLFPINGES